MFFGFSGKASAATYYVSPTGSNTAPYDTWAKAANLLSTVRALNPAGGLHTVYIAPGTYNDQINFGNAAWNNSIFIGTAAHGSITPAQKGQVIFSYSGAASVLDLNTASGIIIQNLSATGGDTTHATVNISSNNTTLDNVYLYDSNKLITFNNVTGALVKNSLLKGASGASMVTGSGLAGSWTIQYSYLTNSAINPAGTSQAIQITSGTLNLYNDFIAGSSGYGAVVTGGNSGTINVKNSIMLPGSNATGAVPVGNNGANNLLNLTNNILVKNWFSGVYKSGTPTSESGTVSSSPLIKKHPRTAFLIPSVDDCENLSYATSVLEPVLAANGEKGTMAIQGFCAGINQSTIQNMLGRGVFSVGVHGYSHSDLSLTGNAFSITKAAYTINIDRINNQIVLSGASPVTVSGFKTKTLSAIRGELSVGGAALGALASGLQGVTLGEVLADSSGAQVSPYTAQLLIDPTGAMGYYNVEINQARATIDSVLGITAPTLIPPFGASSVNVETAAYNAGFSACRPGNFYVILSYNKI